MFGIINIAAKAMSLVWVKRVSARSADPFCSLNVSYSGALQQPFIGRWGLLLRPAWRHEVGTPAHKY